ncbi:cyclin-dependent kinase inhibitor 3 family protein [Psychromonas antarctica]|uniref:cyclin-dependent kinase inhibitor 3 family protein n=1 Tax=Psychromonas antarctica TaxID=67573 RepID=UPI001EE94080|nr:cyclin-dependent kinase inhibitor 3 family protein [Psychromonas antarctica]MCG6200071.1 cyclin-dependent kinase inhibitor 3 family protein [Psychromonas antarctica]
MSVIHPIFPIPIADSAAKIILTPCPGTKGAALIASLEQLKAAGAEAVLTLMTHSELEKNSLSGIGEAVIAQGMSWFHLPIVDDHIPEAEFLRAWKNAGPAVQCLLTQGKSIAIHCKGGSGRTGLLAAQILLQRGECMEPTMACIQAVRANAFTHVCQRDYLNALDQSLKSQ